MNYIKQFLDDIQMYLMMFEGIYVEKWQIVTLIMLLVCGLYFACYIL